MNERARENRYRLLARLYLFEVDAGMCELLKNLDLPDEGYGLMADYIKNAPADWEEQLAVDYARVFLSAGVAQGLAAFPYESVYTSRQRLMMQEAGSSAAAVYAEAGLKPKGSAFTTSGDHIGLEMEYMAELIANNDAKGQRAFFNAHLARWYKPFCQDVQKYAETDFYKGLAKLTACFLATEEARRNV